MNDLPNELREWATWLESRSFATLDGTKARQAADEIERLRAENAWLRNLVPPKMLAAAVRRLSEELKAAEATGGDNAM
jgi:hypothetical protein